MGAVRDLYRGDNDFNFIRVWRPTLVIGLLVALTSVGLLLTRGLNLGIDFEGGGVWEVPVTDVSVEDARTVMDGLGLTESEIQFATNADGTQILRVQAGTDAVDRSSEVTAGVAELAGTGSSAVSVSTVGPSWGEQITEQALRALVFFFIAIAVYMSIRLEWRMAVGALVAVVHDLLFSVGVYSLFQLAVSPATVIAFLTILGFSLYDTIVVFDKARELTARVSGREPYRFIMNRSMNQTLMRSVNTTLTTLLPIGSLLVVGSVFLGATTLQEFALALFIGLASGAYSSIMIAAPITAWFKEREPRFAYSGETPGDGRAVAADPAGSRPAARRARDGAGAPSAGATGAIPPRPRKTKKRR